MTIRHVAVAVVDIGKTNAKVALVDLQSMREVAVRTRPNTVLQDGPYPHYDIDGLWSFILDGLRAVNAAQAVEAISVTTHGATAALLDAAGELALPVLDYECTSPDTLTADYDAARPTFADSGTPRLPMGLNLGAQLFWQARAHRQAFAAVASILMYPQYWSYRLTGVQANELTSLGCHTDLWSPGRRTWSSLVEKEGWAPLMAPVRPAGDRLGPLLPELAALTGIAPGTPVISGIHDSNASLLPHLFGRKPPFTVVSTGTWVICMAVGGKAVTLDAARDTLVNVNAFGDPVPSARFMGGREHAIIAADHGSVFTEADVDAVLGRELMLLPSVQPGSGPFPRGTAAWVENGMELHGALDDARRTVALSFYLAMMTDTCLDLIAADGPSVVEGPFARNTLFARMLATATGRPVTAGSDAATGTSIGAALLAQAPAQSTPHTGGSVILPDARIASYAARWRAIANARA